MLGNENKETEKSLGKCIQNLEHEIPQIKKNINQRLKNSILPVFFLKKASFQYLPDSFIYLLF